LICPRHLGQAWRLSTRGETPTLKIAISEAALAALSAIAPAQAQQANMTFFVTNYGLRKRRAT